LPELEGEIYIDKLIPPWVNGKMMGPYGVAMSIKVGVAPLLGLFGGSGGEPAVNEVYRCKLLKIGF